MKRHTTIVADENVSEEMCVHFISFLGRKECDSLDVMFVAKEHPGMSDGQIIHHLLNDETIFITADRPFHNTVLSKQLTSYYASNGKFVAKKLKGIIEKKHILHNSDLKIKENYTLPETEIRPFLLPSSDKALKKLRTKRRRIRNYFGGLNHIDQVMITISWRSFSLSSAIFGIRLRASSNVGIKAFDASESYISDEVIPDDRSIIALNYALIISIQLMLHFVKTKIYYDSPNVTIPPLPLRDENCNKFYSFFYDLHSNFPDIEFIPSTKGIFIERLQAKLKKISNNKSNEIVSGNIVNIINGMKVAG